MHVGAGSRKLNTRRTAAALPSSRWQTFYCSSYGSLSVFGRLPPKSEKEITTLWLACLAGEGEATWTLQLMGFCAGTLTALTGSPQDPSLVCRQSQQPEPRIVSALMSL